MAERPLKCPGGGDLIPAPKIKFRRQGGIMSRGDTTSMHTGYQWTNRCLFTDTLLDLPNKLPS